MKENSQSYPNYTNKQISNIVSFDVDLKRVVATPISCYGRHSKTIVSHK